MKRNAYKSVNAMALREILNNYLPSDLIYSKKSGFSIPLKEWLSAIRIKRMG